jgi:O-methyltransferase involved in polyketide biosynthesis
MNTERNYSAISPSAKALMLFKAHTQIPFAKQVAKALFTTVEATDSPVKDFGFWASVVHFENRYYSINDLVSEVASPSVLELSSGYNYRGLEFAISSPDIHYIDTDLPEIINCKKEIASSFGNTFLKGKLNYQALNALDEKHFQSVVDMFDQQPITIVTEGLLVYLSEEEKKKLCKTIRKQLVKNGGYWVTSDIYLNHNPGQVGSDKDKKWDKFFNKQQVNQQMFASIEEAEEFFFNNGFLVDKEYDPDYSKLSASQHLLNTASPEQMEKLARSGKIQATWRLKPKE